METRLGVGGGEASGEREGGCSMVCVCVTPPGVGCPVAELVLGNHSGSGGGGGSHRWGV